METVHEGWLSKKPQSEKKLFRVCIQQPKTATQKPNQYWFALKQSGDIPGQFILDYYTDSTCKKQKGRVDLDQCKKIDRKIDTIKPDEYLFSIDTAKRTYNLLAQTKADLNKWLQCLCTVCGFKPNKPDTQLLLQDYQTKSMKNKSNNDIIIISYSNPNLSIDNSQFSQSPPASPTKNFSSNQSNNLQLVERENSLSKEKRLINFDNVTKKWTNCSSTLNRNLNKPKNLPSTFSSATLPIKKSSVSSAYIPISECHTGKSIFENCTNNKKSTESDKISVKFDVKFDDDEISSKQCDSNKENKFDSNKNQSLLDSSINSNHGLLLDSRSPNVSNDLNYDVPRQIKIHKKTKMKDLLDIVPSPPLKEEILYANADSLSTDLTNCNNLPGDYSQPTNYMNCSSQNSNNNLVSNNYINSIELDRHASFRETMKEREYYNNISEQMNNTLPPRPPPRPAKPISIINNKRASKSTSLNSLSEPTSNDINEFDPLQKSNISQLDTVLKPPNILATSPDLMYSIPKSQVELDLERRTKAIVKTSLDTVVPLTHNFSAKDELHRYTNAASDVFSKSMDGHSAIYEYERPTLPCNLNSLIDNFDHQFKVPRFKLNDRTTEPMTPSQIVTSTPLFSDQRHFNFNDQDDDAVFKPQVNRELKPKKSDTSIESLLIHSNKSPINRHSDTLINRTNLQSSSFHRPSSTTINPPLVPSRGNRVILNSNESEVFSEDNKPKKPACKKRSDLNEITYLDLDHYCDNISLNSTMNETSINLNFKDAELMNTSQLTQANQLNSSLNVSSNLNYSHFIFSNKQADTSNLNNTSQFNTLNSSITSPSTVYKTVDFIKTKAFNELKDGLNRKTQE